MTKLSISIALERFSIVSYYLHCSRHTYFVFIQNSIAIYYCFYFFLFIQRTPELICDNFQKLHRRNTASIFDIQHFTSNRKNVTDIGFQKPKSNRNIANNVYEGVCVSYQTNWQWATDSSCMVATRYICLRHQWNGLTYFVYICALCVGARTAHVCVALGACKAFDRYIWIRCCCYTHNYIYILVPSPLPRALWRCRCVRNVHTNHPAFISTVHRASSIQYVLR